jgi:hypothetical protein
MPTATANGVTYRLRELDADTPIIEVALVGSLEDPEVQASLAGAIALQNQTGIPDVLVDASAVSHGLSIPEDLALAAASWVGNTFTVRPAR